MFERGLLMQREMKEVGGRMHGVGMQSGGVAIPGSCNYRSINDTPFPTYLLTKIQEVIIFNLGKGHGKMISLLHG